MKTKAKPDIIRRLTQFFHCQGTSCSGWKSCAVALARCQIADRRQSGAQTWAEYPSDRWGWITDTGRCVGVGVKPAKNVLEKGELLIPVPVPFEGSGRDLRSHAETVVRQMNRRLARL